MKKPFKLYRSDGGQFYFVVMASNGKVLVTSETYTRKRNAIKGIESICYVIYESQLESSFLGDSIEDLTAL